LKEWTPKNLEKVLSQNPPRYFNPSEFPTLWMDYWFKLIKTYSENT